MSASTVGAGLIVGSRIGVPAAVMAGVGWCMTPYLRAIGVLGANDPFRKIGFLVGLAMIFSAGIVDLTFIARRGGHAACAPAARAPAPAVAVGRPQHRPARGCGSSAGAWRWSLVATLLLGQPVGYVLFALVLVFLFVFINGISQGISRLESDLQRVRGVGAADVGDGPARSDRGDDGGQRAAGVDASSACDMQQDRSTGWRLGSKRAIQFRYQAAGIAMGAVLCVVLAKLFMSAYPVLGIDTFAHPEAKVGIWQSAMTYKLVGAIRGIGHLAGYQVKALGDRPRHRHRGRRRAAPAGRVEGLPAVHRVGRVRFCDRLDRRRDLAVEPLRVVDGRLPGSDGQPLVRGRQRGQLVARAQAGRGRREHVGDGGARRQPRAPADAPTRTDELPADMSTTSLVGGGLIAGESLYALGAGIAALFANMILGGK